jgi:signal transduction histidine kinase
LIRAVVNEKKLEYKGLSNLDISAIVPQTSNGLTAAVSRNDLSRAISNLINNSREAMSANGGTIVVSLRKAGRYGAIDVLDNGRGIPAELLSDLGKRPGHTFGKINGNGLGIFYARQLCKKLRGQFSIESTIGLGTKVTIAVPLS